MRQIGVPAKRYSRICRFYQAYLLKEHYPDESWFNIAIQTGYNDYQHLAKDFKEFAGTSPTVFIRECQDNPERLLNIAGNFKGT